MSQFEVVVDDACYPEGPLWIDGLLYWVECTRDALMVLDRGQPHRLWHGPGAGPAAVARGAGDDLWLTAYDSNQIICIGRDGTTRTVLDQDHDGKALIGPNDLVMDRAGGLYFTASGVFELDAPIQGKVYYRAPTGDLREVAGGIHYANGVAISGDGSTLFVSEHFRNRVLSYDVGQDGTLSESQVFAELGSVAPPPRVNDPRLGPDGLKVTSSGVVLIAQYGGGRIIAVRADGTLDGVFEVPYPYTTNVALEPSERSMWVTAFKEDAPPYPGAVFETRFSQ